MRRFIRVGSDEGLRGGVLGEWNGEMLTNPGLDILSKQDDGYVLTISPVAARQRVATLAGV
jgi:hypothetical protein